MENEELKHKNISSQTTQEVKKNDIRVKLSTQRTLNGIHNDCHNRLWIVMNLWDQQIASTRE